MCACSSIERARGPEARMHLLKMTAGSRSFCSVIDKASALRFRLVMGNNEQMPMLAANIAEFVRDRALNRRCSACDRGIGSRVNRGKAVA
jgi:hypothetical protein